jgi:hypothetical protein
MALPMIMNESQGGSRLLKVIALALAIVVLSDCASVPGKGATRKDASTDQSIRSVDFSNFTYPWITSLGVASSF